MCQGLRAETMPNEDRYPISDAQIARDRRLVRGMLKGDQRLLHTFYDEYFPKLYRYAFRRVASPEDVDEIVQSALTNAARRIETYRGEATLLTWLIQICRGEVSKHYRLVRRHAPSTPFLDDDVLRAVVESLEAPTFDDPESAARRSELVAHVQMALDQLPAHYSDALKLKYVDGFSSKEIAQQRGIGDDAVQSLLARARRAFREVCSISMNPDLAIDHRDRQATAPPEES
jgi:RNA polymerase sigma-70 factor, ECF subfamily